MSIDFFVFMFIIAVMIAAVGIRQELIYREERAFRRWFYRSIHFEVGDDDDE